MKQATILLKWNTDDADCQGKTRIKRIFLAFCHFKYSLNRLKISFKLFVKLKGVKNNLFFTPFFIFLILIVSFITSTQF